MEPPSSSVANGSRESAERTSPQPPEMNKDYGKRRYSRKGRRRTANVKGKREEERVRKGLLNREGVVHGDGGGMDRGKEGMRMSRYYPKM